MSTALQAAQAYVARGWNPLPLPFKSKIPTDIGWEKRVIHAPDLPNHFNGKPQNVGVVLGPSSKGLTDVDLDCREAIELAPQVLQPTGAIFGRASAPASHWLYRSSLSRLGKAEIQFRDPMRLKDKVMLLEVRIGGEKGAQTVFPGSVHETDEEIRWDENGDDPAEISDDDLLKRARLLASASLFARYWPGEGARHDAALSLGGFLARAGLKAPQIKFLVEAVAKAAGDPEHKDRKDTAEDAAQAFHAGKPARGYPLLVKAFGEPAARQVAEWLEYAGSTAPDAEDEFAVLRPTPYVWVDPAAIPQRDWLYGRLLIRKFVTATVAPGGLGKSSLVTVETLSQVSGKDLIGVNPKEQLRVWLWNLEDPQEETQRKIQAAALHYRLKPEDIGDRLFVDSGRNQKLVIATTNTKGGPMIVRPIVDALVREIKDKQIDVLVIDPFVSCHELPENDNTAQDMIVKEWGTVAELGNCAVHLLDHSRKMGHFENEVTTESSRGAKAKTDAARVVRVVNRMSQDEGEKSGVVNHRLYFRTYNDKANLAPPADKSDWFELKSVDLGNGPRMQVGSVSFSPGDSVGVVKRWEWPDPLAGMTGQDFEKVAAVIRRGKWRADFRAKAWVGHAVAEALGLDADNKRDRARISGMLGIWIAAGSLVVVEGEDEKRMIKKFVEVKEDD